MSTNLFTIRSSIEQANKLIADGNVEVGVEMLLNALTELHTIGKGRHTDTMAKTAVKGVTAAVKLLPVDQQKEIIRSTSSFFPQDFLIICH